MLEKAIVVMDMDYLLSVAILTLGLRPKQRPTNCEPRVKPGSHIS